MNRYARKSLKILLWLICIVVGIIGLAYVLIQLPYVQNLAKNKAVAFLHDKLKTPVSIGKFSLDFPKNIVLESIYFEDQQGDTLLAVDTISVDISLWRLLRNHVQIHNIDMRGAYANVYTLPDSAYNFEYIINAFIKEQTDTPDTTAAMRFSLSNINLERIRVSMVDSLTGKTMALVLHHFDTEITDFDLANEVFRVPEVNVNGLNVRMRQTKALSEETITTDTTNIAPRFTLPDIELKNIDLANIQIDYGNTVSAIDSRLDLSHLRIEFNELDLPNQRADVALIQLDSTTGSFALGKTAQEAVEATVEEVTTTLEKGWTIHVAKLGINDLDYKYDDLNSREVLKGIDYKHLELTDLNAKATDIFYSSDTLSAKVSELTVRESSGLQLDAFHADIFYSDNMTRLDNLLIETPGSHMEDRIEITYPSIDTIGKDIGVVGINAQFIENEIAVSDLLLVAPFLAKRAPFRNNPNGIIRLNGNVDGRISDLDIANLEVSGIGNIEFRGSGNLTGLPDVNRSTFDLHINELSMSAADIRSLIPPGSIPSTIRMPGHIAMQGAFKGSLRSFTTDMRIQTDFGAAMINGTLRNITSKGRQSYNATIRTTQFDLGRLLMKEDILGKVSLIATVNGSGTDLKTANATAKGEIIEAAYKGYTYHNLVFDGSAQQGELKIEARMRDPNIAFALNGTGSLSGQYPRINMVLDLDTLNLQKLHLYEKDLSLHGQVIADLETADPDFLNGTIDVANAIVGYEGKRYRLDTIHIHSVATAEQDSLSIMAEFFTAELTGNYNLTDIWPALQHTVDEYFDTTPASDSAVAFAPQQVNFHARLIRSPLVEEIFPELKELDDTELTGSFDSNTDEIIIQGVIPRLRYKEYTIDNLNLDVKTENNALHYDVTLDQARQKNFEIEHVSLSGKAQQDVLDIDLQVKDDAEKNLYRVPGQLTSADRMFEFKLLPEGLLLNRQPWTVANDNAVRFGPEGFMVRELKLSHASQSVAINSDPQQLNAPLEIAFADFQIETVTRMVTSDSLLAGGVINGQAQVRNLNTYPVFTSDLTINDFSFHGDTVGNLSLKVNNEKQDTYAAVINLSGGGNEVDIIGHYYDAGEQSRYDLQVYMNRLNMKSIEGFTSGEINNGSGYLSGGFDIKGTVTNPDIRGDIRFHDVGFTVTRFNSYYKAKDEHLEFTDKGLALNDFTLIDTLGNEAVISGFVYTTDYRKFDMDLDVQADNFQVLNSARTHNKLYFGKLFIDAHVHVRGGIQNPAADGSLWINEETDLTIVIPQEDPGLVEREGIVSFVDMDTFQVDRHLALDDSLILSTVTGLDVAVNITIDKEATLNLIIDESNGDYLNVKGTANLTGGIDPSGKLTLSGLYELEEGAYRFSFNQVKREFAIQKGSTIQWTGDPYKADLRVKAVYVANTAPLTLVQKQLAEADQAVINTYKQKIPFEVLLNLEGELMKPNVTFDIELPEGNYGVSSEIVSTARTRLNELRTEPSELNKQVFALLLLNRFISEDPFQNEPREGGISSLARQSASKILSEQLNNIIGGSIAGFDVSFDINSIEDYTTGELQNRTDLTVGLSRQLLDDRLTITVGSNFELEGPQETDRKSTNIAGDVSAEYQLSKDGRYRLRAYRKDEYIVVQGQVVETGIGFVFTADYDQFKDIFSGLTEEERFHKKQRRKALKEHHE